MQEPQHQERSRTSTDRQKMRSTFAQALPHKAAARDPVSPMCASAIIPVPSLLEIPTECSCFKDRARTKRKMARKSATYDLSPGQLHTDALRERTKVSTDHLHSAHPAGREIVTLRSTKVSTRTTCTLHSLRGEASL